MVYKITPIFIFILLGVLLVRPTVAVSLLEGGGVKQNSLIVEPRSFIDAYRARDIGDVVTVRVIENVSAVKRSEVMLNNNTTSDADLTFRLATNKTSTLTPDANNVANMITNVALPVDYSKRNSRAINVDNQEKFITLVSCLVVEIDPQNGNMVVEGSRQILMEGQTKSMYVRGIIYPKDIDSNNEVPSYKLANAQIQIIGSGSLTKDRDSGFVQKLFRRIF